jgi:hypothetical protein
VLIYRSANEAGESGTKSPPGRARKQRGTEARQKGNEALSSADALTTSMTRNCSIPQSGQMGSTLDKQTQKDTAKRQDKEPLPESAPQRRPMTGTLAAQQSCRATSKHSRKPQDTGRPSIARASEGRQSQGLLHSRVNDIRPDEKQTQRKARTGTRRRSYDGRAQRAGNYRILCIV